MARLGGAPRRGDPRAGSRRATRTRSSTSGSTARRSPGAPRATEQEIGRLGAEKAEALLIQRLDDLAAGISSPGANERLQFARAFLARQGHQSSHHGGSRQGEGVPRARARARDGRERSLAARRGVRAAGGRCRHYRGGVLDAVSRPRTVVGHPAHRRVRDRQGAAAAAAGGVDPGSIRRAAIVGPGLDFTDKAEGYDFYPQQTIQPFALIDSLIRLGLATRGDLRLATFDLSPRVNAHLESARRAAAAGRRYSLQLPLSSDDPKHEWQGDLVGYWQAFGGRIGETPAATPPAMSGVRVRGVSIDPAVVLSITPRDLNIIVQRQALAADERFDLVVATNILVYYDAFDQALALSNIASMLRPGGYFLTNYAVAPSASMEALPGLTTPVFFDRQGNGDTIYCYRRR